MLKAISLATVVALTTAVSAFAENAGQVTVHVTGLKNNQGVVRVALFNSADSYDKSKDSEDKAAGAFKKGTAPIQAGNATYIFENVPYGEYALKMFHDEANNGKFLTGMFGIPKVEYAFSNNVLGKFGPAPYEKAKFKVQQPVTALEIQAHSGP